MGAAPGAVWVVYIVSVVFAKAHIAGLPFIAIPQTEMFPFPLRQIHPIRFVESSGIFFFGGQVLYLFSSQIDIFCISYLALSQ